jgi:hypothetical protein
MSQAVSLLPLNHSLNPKRGRSGRELKLPTKVDTYNSRFNPEGVAEYARSFFARPNPKPGDPAEN